MQKRTGFITAAALSVAVIGGAAGMASATGNGGDHDGHNDVKAPITGKAYERATRVALQTTGGGKVTETEKGDEISYYQVEVTKGAQVTDVNLNKSFKVVATKTEAAGADDTNDDNGPNGNHDGQNG